MSNSAIWTQETGNYICSTAELTVSQASGGSSRRGETRFNCGKDKFSQSVYSKLKHMIVTTMWSQTPLASMYSAGLTEQNSYQSSSGKILKMKVEKETDRKPVLCSGVKRENWGKGVAPKPQRGQREQGILTTTMRQVLIIEKVEGR